MNVWIGEGRLVREPELKVVGGGVEVCNITIAVDRKKDKNGEKKTDFVDCTAFGQRAAFVNKYFKKGDGIAIVGRFQSDKYTGQDGKTHTKWGVWIDDVHFPMGKKNSGAEQTNSEPSDPGQFSDVSDEDIPF